MFQRNIEIPQSVEINFINCELLQVQWKQSRILFEFLTDKIFVYVNLSSVCRGTRDF